MLNDSFTYVHNEFLSLSDLTVFPPSLIPVIFYSLQISISSSCLFVLFSDPPDLTGIIYVIMSWNCHFNMVGSPVGMQLMTLTTFSRNLSGYSLLFFQNLPGYRLTLFQNLLVASISVVKGRIPWSPPPSMTGCWQTRCR